MSLARSLHNMLDAENARLHARVDEVLRRHGIGAEPTLHVLQREQWGAEGLTGADLHGPVSLVVIHHWAEPHAEPGISPDEEMSMMRGVERYHLEDRGWAGIGYNFVVFPSGNVYEGRGWGQIGAHARGVNSESVGIAFAINGSAHDPTEASMDACRKLIAHGVRRGAVTPDYTVSGHRDHGQTSCPGDRLYARLDELRT